MLYLYISAHRPQSTIFVSLDVHEVVDDTCKRKSGVDCIGHRRVATICVPARQAFVCQPNGFQMFGPFRDSDL